MELLESVIATLRAGIAGIIGHPLMGKIAGGDLSVPQMRMFALEYGMYCQVFPRCLAAVAANVTDDATRLPLIRNLWEEHGEGVLARSHRERYAFFLAACGVSGAEWRAHVPQACTVQYVNEVFSLCRDGHFLEGLGALGPGTESYTAEEYSVLYAGLRRYPWFRDGDLEFFRIHMEVDQSHASSILDVLRMWAQSDENVALIRRGAERAVHLEGRFWTELQHVIFG
jgi:pyrroloquinoline-quinone synthase